MKMYNKIIVLLFMIVFANCVDNAATVSVIRYESGDVQAIGVIKDSKRVGVWALYDELGTRVDSVKYVGGKKNGWSRGYDLRILQLDKNGQYLDDKEDGVWQTYHQGGAVHSVETFKTGNRIGESVYYYAEGTPKILTTYDSVGRPHGYTKEYYANGALMVTGQYHNGQLDGEWREYYENGLIKEIYHCQAGLWHGVYEKYYANGNISERGTYQEDSPSGVWQYFDINGLITSTKEF